jgi:hypothetical protein
MSSHDDRPAHLLLEAPRRLPLPRLGPDREQQPVAVLRPLQARVLRGVAAAWQRDRAQPPARALPDHRAEHVALAQQECEPRTVRRPFEAPRLPLARHDSPRLAGPRVDDGHVRHARRDVGRIAEAVVVAADPVPQCGCRDDEPAAVRAQRTRARRRRVENVADRVAVLLRGGRGRQHHRQREQPGDECGSQRGGARAGAQQDGRHTGLRKAIDIRR